jgi:hypothetical protein
MASGDYERLTPRERLVMLAQACARNDDVEVRRLHETTPTKHYRAAELEFDVPFRATWQMVYFLSIQLNFRIGTLEMLERLGQLSPAIVLDTAAEPAGCLEELANRRLAGHNGEVAGADSVLEAMSPAMTQAEDSTAETRHALSDFHRLIFDRYARQAAALLASFDAFTRTALNLDGLTVLRAWMFTVADDVERLGIMRHVPDAETLAVWKPFWPRMWNRKMAHHGLAPPSGIGEETRATRE